MERSSNHSEEFGQWKGLKGVIKEIENLYALLESGVSCQVLGTEGGARSFLASGLWALSKGPVVMVVPDARTRDRVVRELAAFKEILGSLLGLPEQAEIIPYPSWELTPYLDEWMHPRVASLRVKGLYALLEGAPVALLATPDALAPRLVAKEVFKKGRMRLRPGAEMDDREGFLKALFSRGYTRTASVEFPGDVAVRGGVIDVFSPVETAPVRIEWEGDTIVGLRLFDPASQRSYRMVEAYTVAPAQEMFPQRSLTEIREALYNLEATREAKREMRRLLQALSAGDSIENRIWLSPYLFDLKADIFAYFSPETRVVWWDPEVFHSTLEEVYTAAQKHFEKRKRSVPLFPEPERLFLPPSEIISGMERYPGVVFGLYIARKGALKSVSTLEAEAFQPKRREPVKALAWPLPVVVNEACRLQGEGYEVWIAEPSGREAEQLGEALISKGVALPILSELGAFPEAPCLGGVIRKEVPEGFLFPRLKFALLSRARSRDFLVAKARGRPAELQITDVAVFREGDPLVHLDYGIGLYRGLKHMHVLGRSGEFLVMEYARGDKLFVPIDRLDRIQRYVGSTEAPPPLDALGTSSWARKKARLREDVAKIAKELLKLYAMRKAVKGHAFGGATEGLQEFEASFPFQETPDQKRAIEDIYRDMASETPMDRLVCGDVGFGKTEVAMRAAFKAVMEGKQVAILVPTTVLAEQHYVNFSQRFSPYPVRVELLSRFRSRADQKAVVADLKKGRVDIVIGTHRLLQKDVVFRDLGLLIIDEEHRFGVTHKELLKKISTTVDVLTLTATPIPRTLQMSLSGLRDLSLINTPPKARLPVITKVARFRKEVIAEGIERELARGGQVFFVHNRVRTISKMARLIQDLVPSARVAYAHGQMDEKDLETVMLSFMRREIDVLVCTTIIESGVDIPNVNTLFVHHAEQFGLSTLYQLRGRIGRSDRQAFAYFLVPHRAILPKEAIKRLQSLQEFSNLGSGFKLSLMDLNIRGGGDLLGRRQSGRIAEVGYELYVKIIEEEVKKLKGEWVEPKPPVDLSLPYVMLLPETYIPETGLRLMFYRRLSKVGRSREVTEIAEELEDRFGPLPAEAARLIEAVRFKIWLGELGITTLHGKEGEVVVGFSEDSRVNRDRLVSLLQHHPETIKLTPSQKLIIRMRFPEPFSEYLKKLRSVLKQFVGCDRNLNNVGVPEIAEGVVKN